MEVNHTYWMNMNKLNVGAIIHRPNQTGRFDDRTQYYRRVELTLTNSEHQLKARCKKGYRNVVDVA